MLRLAMRRLPRPGPVLVGIGGFAIGCVTEEFGRLPSGVVTDVGPRPTTATGNHRIVVSAVAVIGHEEPIPERAAAKRYSLLASGE